MTKNQRLFQQEVERLQRSISKLTHKQNFIQTTELPQQPKRVTAKQIKTLKELKGRNFVTEIDIDTGEIIREADAEEIYKRHSRRKTYAKSRYDPEYQRAYREAHREEIRERNRRYRETHREQIRQSQRRYREKNRERINAQARERRKRKKEVKQTPYYPTYSIYDAIYQVFLNGLAELEKAGKGDPFLVANRKSMLGTGMSVMAENQAQLGVIPYDEHLKKYEEDIVRDIWGIVYASDQPQLESYFTDLLSKLNATGEAISTDTLMKISELEEVAGI